MGALQPQVLTDPLLGNQLQPSLFDQLPTPTPYTPSDTQVSAPQGQGQKRTLDQALGSVIPVDLPPPQPKKATVGDTDRKPSTSKKGVWVNLTSGKVNTDWTHRDDVAPSDDHTWMTYEEFVTFKNAGKRTPSHKFTDRDNGKSFYSSDQKSWFEDKEKTKAIGSDQVPTDRLVNRSRTDRTRDNIQLHDVSTYAVAKKNEKKDDNMEHDHIVAGESIKRRVSKERNEPLPPKKTKKKTTKKKGKQQDEDMEDEEEAIPKDEFKIKDEHRKDSFNGKGVKNGMKWAYDNAPSVEIRGNKHHQGWDHNLYSPTWGYRQKNIDTVLDEKGNELLKAQRPDVDAELPGGAFHRDVDTMLSHTHGLGRTDELQQVGAYRKLYKENIRLDNVNPKSTAWHRTGGDPLEKKAQGGITWQRDKGGKTQGEVTDSMFRGHLRQRVSKPTGGR